MDPIKELDTAYYRERLRIDTSDIHNEVARSSQIYFDVAEKAVFAASRAAQAKENLGKLEAQLYPEMAADLEASGKKSTETAIKNAMLLDPRRDNAWNTYAKLSTEADVLKELKNAFRERYFMLQQTVQLLHDSQFMGQNMKAQGRAADVQAEQVKQKGEGARRRWRAEEGL